MRFDLKKSFGYPVLRDSSEDYIDSSINTLISLSEVFDSRNQFNLEYSVTIDNAEIVNAISNKDLLIVITCFCSKTLHSISIKSFELSGKQLIDMRDFRGDVKIDSEIVVNSSNYVLHSPKFHPEFGSKSFSLVK